jgi:hypothetical protein
MGAGIRNLTKPPSTSIKTGGKVGFVSDSETFQIPGTEGSLILKLFKYPDPTVL